jgi:hypothetical protein
LNKLIFIKLNNNKKSTQRREKERESRMCGGGVSAERDASAARSLRKAVFGVLLLGVLSPGIGLLLFMCFVLYYSPFMLIQSQFEYLLICFQKYCRALFIKFMQHTVRAGRKSGLIRHRAAPINAFAPRAHYKTHSILLLITLPDNRRLMEVQLLWAIKYIRAVSADGQSSEITYTLRAMGKLIERAAALLKILTAGQYSGAYLVLIWPIIFREDNVQA